MVKKIKTVAPTPKRVLQDLRDTQTILYWAYGSNLCEESMRRRCPLATKVGPMDVHDAALVFRGVADVVVRRKSVVRGGLWRITAACEAALDRYEGVNQGLYMKRYLTIKIQGRSEDCLFYQMRMSRGVMPPAEHYIETIARGYQDFGLDPSTLDAALQEAWSGKKVTDHLRRRHVMRGAPRLARAISKVDTQQQGDWS